MSKHPIPDWLRSQFSRIEDDVRKLGPCGVFTQMRTVTQTYFEQQVAAPQTPALGGDVVSIIIRDLCETEPDDSPNAVHVRMTELKAILEYHLAPLQAEVERLKEESFEELYNAAIDERDQLKARRDELESLLAKLQQPLSEAAMEYNEEFEELADEVVDALSKPAGSEKV